MKTTALAKVDPAVARLIKREEKRQQETLMLIPSENYASAAVEAAVGSCLANKYAEGYPGRRYYQGQEVMDQIERLVQERAKKLFGVVCVNVQPYSGSPANAAVYFALLKPGQKIMGMKLSSGGHLTHGHPRITFSGRFYQSVSYTVRKDGWLDYDQVERLALKERPQIIVAGYTAYPRKINWRRFAQIAQKAGAFLLADISHIAGLIVAGVHPSPARFADVIMTTTHKTLRGPRGAIIMVTKKGLRRDSQLAKKIDKAVFPGLQGGPHMNTIAGIGVCLREASRPAFKEYGRQIISNAKALAKGLKKRGFKLVSGGTDNHLMVVDLRNKGVDGKTAAEALEQAGLVVNANTVPYDPRPPQRPSGIRLGTPAVTSRGMREKEMERIADWIHRAIEKRENEEALARIRGEVKKLCKKFPIKRVY